MPPRDPLAVLGRLREAAVAEAGRALAQARDDAGRAGARLDAQRERMRREQADAGPGQVADFAAWLPQARLEARRREAALLDAEAQVAHSGQALAACRAEAEAVAKALGRRADARALAVARREQAVMDEAAGRGARKV